LEEEILSVKKEAASEVLDKALQAKKMSTGMSYKQKKMSTGMRQTSF